METHSSILAWRIPWTEKTGRQNPWSHKAPDTTERSTAVYSEWRQAGNSPEPQRKRPMQRGYMSMYFLSYYSKVLVAQSCPTLCDPTDSSPEGSSVHEILQARILEWVAIPFSRGSSGSRDQPHISYVSSVGRPVLYHLNTREAL